MVLGVQDIMLDAVFRKDARKELGLVYVDRTDEYRLAL